MDNEKIKLHFSANPKTMKRVDTRHALKCPWSFLEEYIRSAIENGGQARLVICEDSPSDQYPDAWTELGCVAFISDPGRYILRIDDLGGISDQRGACWVVSEDLRAYQGRVVFDTYGDEWDAKNVVTDPKIAVRVFKELYETLALSEKILKNFG